ncbi:hypothetical protein NS365_21945 [Aureimonas ureilytica]|uniref:Uncharacterized protein n=1 Tax=Aureimonas ureilytica TaxID=401562 RepID=A0A175REP6_9HYPH|nr:MULTISPECIES: hypothetical protein [Aureimonas]KTR02277.1 hypothetical protein NS365_21945 [Aureimonas ureilytica]
MASKKLGNRPDQHDRRNLKIGDLTRYFAAWAMLAICMSTLGYKAIGRCIEAQAAQVLDRQENFRSFRTASSEAGR